MTTPRSLPELALAFVVNMQGDWTPRSLDDFAKTLAYFKVTATSSEIDAALAVARTRYEASSAHLFVCEGIACARMVTPAMRAAADAVAGRTQGRLHVTYVDCLAACSEAPVVTLRVGARAEMFAHFKTDAEWAAVLEFAERAATAHTLLVDYGAALPFRHDPVHDEEHGEVPMALEAVQFLHGHFVGEGRYRARPGRGFIKEVVGTWEAGGKFLQLKMGATYGLPDGRKDTHTVIVMLGATPEGNLSSRAYTDGGMQIDFPITIEPSGISFPDRVPHGLSGRTARKTLSPADGGYDESLVISKVDGSEEIYYTVHLRRPAVDSLSV